MATRHPYPVPASVTPEPQARGHGGAGDQRSGDGARVPSREGIFHSLNFVWEMLGQSGQYH